MRKSAPAPGTFPSLVSGQPLWSPPPLRGGGVGVRGMAAARDPHPCPPPTRGEGRKRPGPSRTETALAPGRGSAWALDRVSGRGPRGRGPGAAPTARRPSARADRTQSPAPSEALYERGACLVALRQLDRHTPARSTIYSEVAPGGRLRSENSRDAAIQSHGGPSGDGRRAFAPGSSRESHPGPGRSLTRPSTGSSKGVLLSNNRLGEPGSLGDAPSPLASIRGGRAGKAILAPHAAGRTRACKRRPSFVPGNIRPWARTGSDDQRTVPGAAGLDVEALAEAIRSSSISGRQITRSE